MRVESCHVFEDTIQVDGSVEPSKRHEFLDRLLSDSAKAAAANNQSLGLVRPKNPRFIFKKKKAEAIEAERQLFIRAGRQTSFLDADLESF